MTRNVTFSGKSVGWGLCALLLAIGAAHAARPELEVGSQDRRLRVPAWLETLGLRPVEPPAAPKVDVPSSARTAFERLTTATSAAWTVDWDESKGTPVMIFGGAAGPYPGGPEAAARKFLVQYADLFNLTGMGELRHDSTLVSRAGHHVSFVQHHRGLPVYGGTLLVLVDDSGLVRMASGGFHSVPSPTSRMRLSADRALEAVLRHVDGAAALTRDVAPRTPAGGLPTADAIDYGAADVRPADLIRLGRARPAWYPTADGFRGVWLVDVVLADPLQEFRAFIDAESGESIDAVMRTMSTHEPIRVYTINPDKTPLTDEAIPDGDKSTTGGPLDGDFTIMANQQAPVIADGNYLHSTDPNDPTVDFNFDEQNVYYHSNLFRQFFVDLNGGPVFGSFFNLDTNPLDAVVHRVDSGEVDVDNASYTPSLDLTRYGHGSFHTGNFLGLRDFALEESIVYHEYSHRMNDNIAGFSGSSIYNGALNEAFADYWAASFSDDKYIGEFSNPDPEVGDDSGWIGFSGFIRSMDNDRTLSQLCDNPFTTSGCEVHSDGEIFAGLLWDARQAFIAALGKQQGVSVLDQIALEALFNMSGGSPFDNDTFIEGRGALLTAESTLFGGAYACILWRVFAEREMGNGASDGSPPSTAPTTSTALPASCSGAATVAFSKPIYTCASPDSGSVRVTDPDGGTVDSIVVATASGDSEQLALIWSVGVADTPVFSVDVSSPVPGNGIVEVATEGELISATYADDSPSLNASATATVDCSPDLRLIESRLTAGSCNDDDPFLDAGESAVFEALVALDLGLDLDTTFLDGLTLTLVSNNPDVTVVAPATISPLPTVVGTRLEFFGRWGVQAAAGASPGSTADFEIQLGGPGVNGAQSPILHTQILEQDLAYSPQVVTYGFTSGTDGFSTAANGPTGTESWIRETVGCVTPPNLGYWKEGNSFCGLYGIGDSSWLLSPFVRIQPANATYPSRLTRLKYQHRVDFGVDAQAGTFIESDRFDQASSLAQLPAFYDQAANTPGLDFVQEDIDLTTGIPGGVDLSHGWVRFRWLFLGNAGGTGAPVVNTGWYIDDVQIHYETPSVVGDANDAATCAPSVTLDFAASTILDGIAGAGGGNADGIIDPGETINLPISVRNSGNGPAQTIGGTLSSDRPDIITISDDTAAFPNLLPAAIGSSDPNHFTFDVSPSAACGTFVNFTLTLDHNGVGAASTVNFVLRVGTPLLIFADDFESDSGNWSVNLSGTDTATTGAWERVDPTQNFYSDVDDNNETQPGDDFDPGSATGQCFVTQDGGAPFNLHDVDGGRTTLTSAVFDLSSFVDPNVSFARWVYNRDGDALDAFLFQISNNGGANWTTVESVSDANGIPFAPVTNVWTEVEFLISSSLPVTDQMRFRFVAQDQSGQIIEAAVDAFRLFDSTAVCSGLPAPAEVSPPGAAVPFRVDRPSAAALDLTWQTTAGAVTYRIVSGAIADLQAQGGVSPTNATPIACGIVGTATTLAEPAGSVFLLVQAEGSGGVGTAGSGRSPGATCP